MTVIHKNKSYRLKFLKTLTMLEHVQETLLEQLAEYCHIDDLERGDVLWREGSEAHYFSFVISGHIKMARNLQDGREVILGVFGESAPIGHSSVFQNTPYHTSAEALDDVRIARIPRVQLLSILRRDKSLMEALLLSTMERNRLLTQRVTDLATASAEQRLALLFVAFSESDGVRCRDDEGMMGVFISIPLSRQDIASLINTRIETAIRLMSRWNKSGIVSTKPHGFWVSEPETLAALAQGFL